MEKMVYKNDEQFSDSREFEVLLFGFVPQKNPVDEPLAVVSFKNEDGAFGALKWVPAHTLRPVLAESQAPARLTFC
jgi:hypothetical protein